MEESRSTRRRLRLLSPAMTVACIGLAAALQGPSGAGAAPRTVLVTPKPIAELAQRGGRVAWTSTEIDNGCGETWVGTLATQRRVRLHRSCGPGSIGLDYGGLAFDGRRAVWREIVLDIHSDSEGEVMTAAVDDRRVRTLEYVYLDGLETDFAAATRQVLDGDRNPLVYGWIGRAVLNYDQCTDFGPEPPSEECRFRLAGVTWHVVGRSKRRVRQVPPAVALSAAAGRIAYVPAVEGENPATWDQQLVVVRRLEDGAHVTEFAPPGRVRALALGRTSVAVLVATDAGETRIERYHPVTGTSLGGTAVPRATAPVLDVAGTRILFRVGRSIRVVDGDTGEASVVWAGRQRPIDPSLEGRRVVWGVNGRGRGRVLALNLP